MRELLRDHSTLIWEHQLLNMTVEISDLLQWYGDVFDDEERRLARLWLEASRFDVEGFLAQGGTVSPPARSARRS